MPDDHLPPPPLDSIPSAGLAEELRRRGWKVSRPRPLVAVLRDRFRALFAAGRDEAEALAMSTGHALALVVEGRVSVDGSPATIENIVEPGALVEIAADPEDPAPTPATVFSVEA